MCAGIGVASLTKEYLVESIVYLASEIARQEKRNQQLDNVNLSSFSWPGSRKELAGKSKKELLVLAKQMQNTLFRHFSWNTISSNISLKHINKMM
jgi:hypothetical protein